MEPCRNPRAGSDDMRSTLSNNTIPLPTVFKFEPMTEVNARAATRWCYEPPYDFYNLDASKLDEIIYNSFLNPVYQYYAVLNSQGTLIAYRCFGKDAQVPGGDYSADALDMGGGLRPDLTGQGLGPQIMRAAMEFARPLFAPRAFRVTVAEFNLRARRACEKIGYVPAQRFIAPHNGISFVILMRNA
jgi:[ribosomal protein S18]-alanine N-acetyltransferase